MVKRSGVKQPGPGKSPRPRAAGPRSPSSGKRSPARKKSNPRKSSAHQPFWRKAIRLTAYWGAVAAVWCLVIVAGIFAYYAASLPQISDLQVPKRAPNMVIVDVSGAVLASRGIGHGQDIRYQDLPEYLPHAVIAIEDRRFRSHYGVDVIGLARATMRNLWARRIVEGGSTLTQQLAKNLFLKPERTLRRKIQEMILAIWLEANYSKDEIIELYLNRVYFGAGAYGVEAASRRYFGKSARHVTLAEASILAGLLKAPSRYAPTRNPSGANARAQLVLANMVQEGFITAGQSRAAGNHQPGLIRGNNSGSTNYIADWVSEILPQYIGQPETDITVVTTIDLDLQAAAEIALRNVLDEAGEARNVSQGSLVAMDGSGAVRALIGGRSYANSQFNRAVRALRQPGSAFKPFVYLAALERGMTPDTIRRDRPIRIGNWSPGNYSDEFEGDMTLRYALAHSVNTVAVRLTREVGPRAVGAVAQRLGIQSQLHRNVSLALGTAEVTLYELTAAYAPFANGGFGVVPHIISQVRAADGEILYAVTGSGPGRVIAARDVAMMNDMMQTTLQSGTGRKAAFGWPAAGKTGTSQEFRDAWFLGFTANLVAGVWLGNDDGTPTNKVTGGSLPATIWRRFMAAAHEGQPVRPLMGFREIPLPVLRVDPGAPGANPAIQSPTRPDLPTAALGAEENRDPPGNGGSFLQRVFGGKS